MISDVVLGLRMPFLSPRTRSCSERVSSTLVATVVVVRLTTCGPKGSEQGSKTLVGWATWWITIPQQTSRMECHMVFVEFRAFCGILIRFQARIFSLCPWSNEYHASLPKISRLHHHPCPVDFFGVCRRCTLRATRATTISSWLLLPAPSPPLMVWRSAMEKNVHKMSRIFLKVALNFKVTLVVFHTSSVFARLMQGF